MKFLDQAVRLIDTMLMRNLQFGSRLVMTPRLLGMKQLL
ncbi:hypothetical protein B4079_5891 [Bacillus cereus]|nr:hypothetical protein B4079_5891 [Bacillus cereus]